MQAVDEGSEEESDGEDEWGLQGQGPGGTAVAGKPGGLPGAQQGQEEDDEEEEGSDGEGEEEGGAMEASGANSRQGAQGSAFGQQQQVEHAGALGAPEACGQEPQQQAAKRRRYGAPPSTRALPCVGADGQVVGNAGVRELQQQQRWVSVVGLGQG